MVGERKPDLTKIPPPVKRRSHQPPTTNHQPPSKKRSRRRCGVAGISGRSRGNWVEVGDRWGQRPSGEIYEGMGFLIKPRSAIATAVVFQGTAGGSYPNRGSWFALVRRPLRRPRPTPAAAERPVIVRAYRGARVSWSHVGSWRLPFSRCLFVGMGELVASTVPMPLT